MFDGIKLCRDSNPDKEARQLKYEEFTGRMDSLLKEYSGLIKAEPLKNINLK